MRVLLFAILLSGCGGVVAQDGAAQDAGDPLGTLIFDYAETNGPGQSSFYGVFYPDAQHASGGCTTSGNGACAVWTCAPDTSSAIGAGTLTLTEGTTIDTVTQSSSGVYSNTVAAFEKGDVLGVSGPGAQAPAFATQTVVAPGDIVVTSPLVGSTTSDTPVAWSGGESGARVYFEVAGTGSGTTTFVLCRFDAASGKGIIPQTTIAALHPVTGEIGALLWGQERTTTFVAGTYPIQLVARRSAGASFTFQ